MSNFTEEEIQLAMIAHNCSEEEAISTYAAMVRSARESYRVEAMMESLRFARNERLKETDWIVSKYSEINQPIPDNWREYRQALRDITNTYSSLEEVVWPDKPL